MGRTRGALFLLTFLYWGGKGQVVQYPTYITLPDHHHHLLQNDVTPQLPTDQLILDLRSSRRQFQTCATFMDPYLQKGGKTLLDTCATPLQKNVTLESYGPSFKVKFATKNGVFTRFRLQLSLDVVSGCGGVSKGRKWDKDCGETRKAVSYSGSEDCIYEIKSPGNKFKLSLDFPEFDFPSASNCSTVSHVRISSTGKVDGYNSYCGSDAPFLKPSQKYLINIKPQSSDDYNFMVDPYTIGKKSGAAAADVILSKKCLCGVLTIKSKDNKKINGRLHKTQPTKKPKKERGRTKDTIRTRRTRKPTKRGRSKKRTKKTKRRRKPTKKGQSKNVTKKTKRTRRPTKKGRSKKRTKKTKRTRRPTKKGRSKKRTKKTKRTRKPNKGGRSKNVTKKTKRTRNGTKKTKRTRKPTKRGRSKKGTKKTKGTRKPTKRGGSENGTKKTKRTKRPIKRSIKEKTTRLKQPKKGTRKTKRTRKPTKSGRSKKGTKKTKRTRKPTKRGGRRKGTKKTKRRRKPTKRGRRKKGAKKTKRTRKPTKRGGRKKGTKKTKLRRKPTKRARRKKGTKKTKRRRKPTKRGQSKKGTKKTKRTRKPTTKKIRRRRPKSHRNNKKTNKQNKTLRTSKSRKPRKPSKKPTREYKAAAPKEVSFATYAWTLSITKKDFKDKATNQVIPAPNKQHCQGVLIGMRHALTTAGCVQEGFQAKHLKVEIQIIAGQKKNYRTRVMEIIRDSICTDGTGCLVALKVRRRAKPVKFGFPIPLCLPCAITDVAPGTSLIFSTTIRVISPTTTGKEIVQPLQSNSNVSVIQTCPNPKDNTLCVSGPSECRNGTRETDAGAPVFMMETARATYSSHMVLIGLLADCTATGGSHQYVDVTRYLAFIDEAAPKTCATPIQR